MEHSSSRIAEKSQRDAPQLGTQQLPPQSAESQGLTEVGTARVNGTKCFSDWQWKEQTSQHGNLGGFSASPSTDGAVDGVYEPTEDEIAEKIFDWWISGKSYTEWYAEKYLQLKIPFDDLGESEEEENTL